MINAALAKVFYNLRGSPIFILFQTPFLDGRQTLTEFQFPSVFGKLSE